MHLKPLGVVKEIVESAGMAVTYVYDDLVFIDHNALLLRFTENDHELVIHINSEADGLVLTNDIVRLQTEAEARKMVWRIGEHYSLRQEGDAHVCVEFFTR